MISRLRGWAKSIARREREPRIDKVVDPAQLAAFLAHVEGCWRHLGETEPHWSVITSPLFKAERIEETRDEFFASGEREWRRWEAAARRCGVEFPLQGTCLELGCGVGRVTVAREGLPSRDRRRYFARPPGDRRADDA